MPITSAIALRLLNMIKGTKLIVDKTPARLVISSADPTPTKLQVKVTARYNVLERRNQRVIGGEKKVRLIKTG